MSNMLAVGWDGKGVPMIIETVRSSKEGTQKIERLKKGEKRGVKKMATVSVTAEFKPVVRDKETIIVNIKCLLIFSDLNYLFQISK